MKIALWTLGSLEHKIVPTKENIDALRKEIDKLNNGEQAHIVWGPELSVQTIEVDVIPSGGVVTQPNQFRVAGNVPVSLYNGPDQFYPVGS